MDDLPQGRYGSFDSLHGVRPISDLVTAWRRGAVDVGHLCPTCHIQFSVEGSPKIHLTL